MWPGSLQVNGRTDNTHVSVWGREKPHRGETPRRATDEHAGD